MLYADVFSQNGKLSLRKSLTTPFSLKMSQKTQYRLIAKVSYRLVIRQSTPLNSEIICVQNVGAKVEMVSYLKK